MLTVRENDFRARDEAWLMVDVDEWGAAEFAELLAWEAADSRHHLAVSNPKFELFLAFRNPCIFLLLPRLPRILVPLPTKSILRAV